MIRGLQQLCFRNKAAGARVLAGDLPTEADPRSAVVIGSRTGLEARASLCIKNLCMACMKKRLVENV